MLHNQSFKVYIIELTNKIQVTEGKIMNKFTKWMQILLGRCIKMYPYA